MNNENKMRFLNVYQNLPLNERKNTIVVIDDPKSEIKKKPISWDIAFIEIDQETLIGEKILTTLIKLNLI